MTTTMRWQTFPVGAVYMLRGGDILRYRGVYAPATGRDARHPSLRAARAASDPCLAFGPVVDEGPFDPPVGASVAATDVLYQITPSHLPMLRDRLEQMLARKLDVADIEHLIAELEKGAGT